MKKPLTVAAAVLSLAASTPATQAQQNKPITKKHPVTHRKVGRKSAGLSVAEELHAMRAELQAEIDELKASMAAKDAEIVALQRSNQNAQQAVTSAEAQSQATSAQVQTLDTTVQQNTTAVTAVQSSVSNLQVQSATVATTVQTIDQKTDKLQKSIDEPVAFHYKGVTITPGGFVAGEAVRRSRALGSDIYTNYNAIPYPGADTAHESELYLRLGSRGFPRW